MPTWVCDFAEGSMEMRELLVVATTDQTGPTIALVAERTSRNADPGELR